MLHNKNSKYMANIIDICSGVIEFTVRFYKTVSRRERFCDFAGVFKSDEPKVDLSRTGKRKYSKILCISYGQGEYTLIKCLKGHSFLGSDGDM